MPNAIELVINGQDNTGGAFASAGGGLASIGNIATGILTSQVFTQIAGAVVDFGKAVIEKSIEAQNGQAKFQAQLEATGHAADGTAEMVDKYAQQILKTTTYDDDAAKASATVLLGFKRIGQDVLPQAIQASADLAAKMGIDMPAAAAMVAKALGGDLAEGGIGKLNTAFKLFDKEQLQVVEDMAAAGDQAGAQKMILDALNDTVGGQAAAAGKTFEGSWKRITNNLDNMQEAIGGPLLDVLATLFDKLLNTGIFDAMGEAATNLGNGVSVLAQHFAALAGGNLVPEALNKFMFSLSSWWTKNGPAITAQINILIAAFSKGFQQAADKIQPFVNTYLKRFSEWFTENGPLITRYIAKIVDNVVTMIPVIVSTLDVILPLLGTMITALMDYGKFFMQLFTGDMPGAFESFKTLFSNVFSGLKTTVVAFINWVMSFFGTNLKAVTKTWEDNFKQLNQIVTSIMGMMQTAINTKIAEIKEYFSTGVQNWIDAIAEEIYKFQQLGTDMIDNIKTGLSGAVDKVKGIGGSILSNIQTGVTENITAFTTFMQGTITAAINAALAALGLPPIGSNKIGGSNVDVPGYNAGSDYIPQTGIALLHKGERVVPASVNNRQNINQAFYNFGTYNGGPQTNGNSTIDKFRR